MKLRTTNNDEESDKEKKNERRRNRRKERQRERRERERERERESKREEARQTENVLRKTGFELIKNPLYVTAKKENNKRGGVVYNVD